MFNVVICLHLIVSPYNYNKTKTIYIWVLLLPSLFRRLRTREECRRFGLYYSTTLQLLTRVRFVFFTLPCIRKSEHCVLWTVNGWFNTAGSVLQHGVLVWSLQSCTRQTEACKTYPIKYTNLCKLIDRTSLVHYN